jgi:hypothetical protein
MRERRGRLREKNPSMRKNGGAGCNGERKSQSQALNRRKKMKGNAERLKRQWRESRKGT